MPTSIPSRATSSLISRELANSLADAVEAADGATIAMTPLTPEAMFQRAIESAIDAVENKGQLLRAFLLRRPYSGNAPRPDGQQPLSDEECAAAITMLYSHVVNSFKGELAEILAIAPLTGLVSRLKADGEIPNDSRLLLGDAARPHGRHAPAKGADFHLLAGEMGHPELVAVGEVKSFVTSPHRLAPQLSRHINRALVSLRLNGHNQSSVNTTPHARPAGVLRISISLSLWRLSRGYHFEEKDGRSFLHFDPLPPIPETTTTKIDPLHWHIELGWSQEALSAEAYGLTFWYMQQLGADIFADHPSPWPEMTPMAAGVNAATEALFHSIARCTAPAIRQRAIALYNAQGFGYSLGTSYKDASGRRQMLWPKDLREMLITARNGRSAWLHD